MNIIKKISVALFAVALLSMTILASQNNKMVEVDLWNAHLDQPSMGNVATDNNTNALYNAEENTLQIATNPVDVSGYVSGITSAEYDSTGNGDFVEVKVLTTEKVETGTKFDGVNKEIEFLSSFEIILPENLTKTGVEYIDFKMSVPYTPMDTVVGTGFLDARLKIDWSRVSDTEISEIIPNTSISAGSVLDVELSQLGVKISSDTTVIPENTELKVTKISTGSDYELAKKAIGNDAFELIKIELMANGKDVTPTGSVEIALPYTGDLELYRINESGSKTVLRGTSATDEYKILSRSVGLFAIVGGESLLESTPNFNDISNHWAKDYIETAVSEGLFAGTSENTFSPDNSMTEAMAIVVLHRIAGEPYAETSENLWYSEAKAWGIANGIIGGYTDFNANQNITRELLATMIYKYEMTINSQTKTADLSSFSDANIISDWAKDAFSWANANGIVTGKSETTLAPKDGATRAEVATMFVRFIEV